MSDICENWWNDLFPYEPLINPPGEELLHCIIAYDISSPQRLARMAKTLLDFGYRAQYSVFECHMSLPQLHKVWESIKPLIHPKQDRLVAYALSLAITNNILTAGVMVSHKKSLVYLVDDDEAELKQNS